ncbi:MAG: DUF979 domain-containing protein [bacterium]
MSFFLSDDFTIGQKSLEVLYIVIGIISIHAGFKNFMDKDNKSSLGTGIFWTSLGIVIALGRWIPPMINGILVILMVTPAILKKVQIGKVSYPTPIETKANFDKIGLKIFVPALSIGIVAIIFAVFLPKIGALVGVGVGVLIASILLMIYSSDNKPVTFLRDSERLLSTVGPLSILPMLLAALGSIFTKAGVGEIIASIVGNIIPEGNVTIGIIVFAISMMLFTMIMGNAFAAITVMTVGIGGPFVLEYGADPAIVGMLALTCGYCGTLLTPMAANFNIVPVAILEMKDKFGVIKNQVFIAFAMLIFQIIYMINFS